MEEIMTTISDNLAYQEEPEDNGFYLLTRTRYTSRKVKEIYVCELDFSKKYKISIEEVNVLPEVEQKVFEERIELEED